MYLTQFKLNRARFGARRLVSSPEALHAAVRAAIPGDHVTDHGRQLWRLDQQADGGHVLYMTSTTVPDLTHLVEQAGWPTLPDGWRTKSLTGLFESLHAGQEWNFRLAVNPVQVDHTHPDRVRVVVRQTDRTAWLVKSSPRWGFTVRENDIRTLGDDNLSFRKGKGNVTLVRGNYFGKLTITDPDALRTAMSSGLGRGRAYGCGLLTLAPTA